MSRRPLPPKSRTASKRRVGLLAIHRSSEGSLLPLKSGTWSVRFGNPRATVQHHKGQVQGTARGQPAASHAIERGRGTQFARQQPHSVGLIAPRARHPMHAPGAPALVPNPTRHIAVVAADNMSLSRRRTPLLRCRWRPQAIVVAVGRSLSEPSQVLTSHVAFPNFV
jgi:hypothetical protein